MQPKSINGFPSDFTDVEEKQLKQFNLQWAKAIWNDSDKGFTGSLGSGVDRFIELRRRAEGRTPINEYKNQMIADGNTAFLTLNWAVSDPIKQIVNEMVGGFINREYKPQCEALDQTSRTELDKKRKELLFNKIIAKQAEQIQQETGVDIIPNKEEVFESEEEIDLHLQMNVKASSCLGMELLLTNVLDKNKKDYIIRKVYRDLVVLGKGAVKVSYDHNNDIRWRHVDPVNLVTSYAKEDDFSDIKYAGEIITMTVDRLAEVSDLTDEELFNAAKSNANKWGNPEWDSSWGKAYYPANFQDGRPYTSFKVKVMDCEYLSTDYQKYLETDKGDGRVYFDKVKLAYEPSKRSKHKKTVKELRKDSVYKCKWIINTDYCYDFGRKVNQIYEKENDVLKLNTQLSYIVFAPNIYDMENKSLVEHMIPYADEMNLIQLNIQNYIAASPPAGMAVDTAGMTNVLKALGDVASDAMDVLEIYKQTGKLFFSSVDDSGEFVGNQKPVTPLNPDFSPIMQMAQLHEYYKGLIREVIGISAGRSPMMPDSKAAVGVEKMALYASENSTRYLQNGFLDIFNRGLKVSSIMIQDSIENLGKEKDFAMLVGQTMADSLEVVKKLPLSKLGIKISLSPDAVEQERFELNIQSALTARTITASDAVMLREQAKTSIELAARYMSIREKKKMEQEQAAQQEMVIAQPRAQAEAEAKIQQEKRETIGFEYEKKKELLMLEFELKGRLSTQDHQEDMDKTIVTGEQKIEQIEKATEITEGSQEKKSGEAIPGSIPKAAGVRQPKIPQGGA